MLDHPHTLREAVRGMSDREALDYALEAYEQVAGQTDADLALGLSLGLTPQQAAMFGLLNRNLGLPVSHDRIHAVMDAGDTANTGATKVRISVMRSKLAGRYEISNVWGVGYQMEAV